jgi:hypothetical protein
VTWPQFLVIFFGPAAVLGLCALFIWITRQKSNR